MRITINKDASSFSGLIKLIGIGWFFGFGALFLVPMIIGLIIFMLAGNWQQVGSLLIGILLAPLILVFHAFFVGTLIWLGLFLFRRVRPIEIQCVSESSNQRLQATQKPRA